MNTHDSGCGTIAVRWVTVIVFLAFTTMVGCFVGLSNSSSSFLYSSASVRWESLGSPPEKAIKILDADIDYVTVESVSGKIFNCDISPKRQCWVAANQFSSHGRNNGPCFTETPIPDPQGKIVDRAEAWMCEAELVQKVRYSLSEDGTIWMWRYAPGSIFPGLDSIIPSSTIGFFAGVIVVILMLTLTHDRKQSQGAK